jgi:nucleoside-diphosphate-sugar epimerase
MKVLVTGASGFVGRHVVKDLLEKGHSVIAVGRDIQQAKKLPWFDQVEFVTCDLHVDFSLLLNKKNIPDAIIHLAWPGLPNYNNFFHVKKNLPHDLHFLESAINKGVNHIIVAGTCLEYGMQYGPLHEDIETKPITPYGFAKDALRKSLEFKKKEISYTLQWLRLFYVYGEGQNENSLLSQLDRAIAENEMVFNMSKGDQIRDFLPVKIVANFFTCALENPAIEGVINCCSGVPTSVLEIVQNRCIESNSDISLNRGYYNYPIYEPFAFWGIPGKLINFLK